MNQKIRILFAYSGDDDMIEPERSEELLDDIGLKEECRLVYFCDNFLIESYMKKIQRL